MHRAPLTRLVAFVCAASLTVACSGSSSSSGPTIPHSSAALVSIDLTAPGRAFPRELLGTNLPAWVGRGLLADEGFRRQVVDSGVTLIRMPGGSWSNGYDWTACEQDQGCAFSGPARPSDYAAFLHATGLEGMWTLPTAISPQAAAALVAFFGGSATDQRTIGTDRSGHDWGTVGSWATLRTEHGAPDPVPIRRFELGNEVYGAKPSAGPGCASYGWEDVWTCSGKQYAAGDATHSGYAEIRSAMQAVDPHVVLGAVGVLDPASWNQFGTEVIAGTAGVLDSYSIHEYPFFEDASPAAVLGAPEGHWDPAQITSLRQRIDAANPGRSVQVAVTEYNVFSGQDADREQQMTRASGALFLADTIGRMARAGVDLAAQWNLVNGTASNGTDYGVIEVGSRAPRAALPVFALWHGFAGRLVAVTTSLSAAKGVSVSAALGDDGVVSLLAVNKQSSSAPVRLQLTGATGTSRLQVRGISFTDVTSTSSTPVDRLAGVPESTWAAAGDVATVTGGVLDGVVLPPLSAVLLRLVPTV